MLHHRAVAHVRSARRAVALLAIIAIVLVGSAGVAAADDVSNNVDGTVDATVEVLSLNVGAADYTVQFFVQATGTGNAPADGKSGCNITGQTELQVSVASSNTSVATVSPTSLTFTSCGTNKAIAVHPVGTGTTHVTLTQTGNTTGGTFNFAPAAFDVTVAAPAPANTAPVVTVGGVANGATYNKGSVPPATCTVTDAEDGTPSVSPTLSAITGPSSSDGLGSQTATCSYTDLGPGTPLTTTVTATYSIVDPSAPDIGYTLNPAGPNGANGWYTGDVSLTWGVTEPQSPNSLTKTGCVDQNVTSDQAATTYSCSATSSGGSAGPVSVSIKRDGSAPNAPLVTLSPAKNGADWNNSDVTVHFASDGDNGPSGVAGCTGDIPVTAEASNQTFSGTCTDAAGNVSPTTQVTVNLDKTAPTVSNTVVVSGTEGTNGWYISDVDVTFTATDDLSGLTVAEASQTVTSVGEGTAVQVLSPAFTDRAGNTRAAGAVSRTFKIDTQAPNAPTATLSTPANANGWHNSPVTVHFEPNGDNGPSGAVTCTANVTVDTDTDATGQTVSGTCTDAAGNESAPTSKVVKLDTQAPNAPTATLSTAANANGWHKANVSVHFTSAGDNGASAVSSCTADVTVSTDGGGQHVPGTCTDNAGNTSAPTTQVVNLDKTAPIVGINGGPLSSSYYFGQVPAAPTCTASDATSGLDGSCSISGYSTAVGPHTITASATDLAGNTTNVTRTYTVLAWTTLGYYQPVDMNGVLNTVKGGSTVPLKFELFAGSTELTDVASIASFTTSKVTCDGSAATDTVELLTTGGTTLRYDGISGQFIQNWKTPTTTGQCFKATMTAQDGSSISALFKIK